MRYYIIHGTNPTADNWYDYYTYFSTSRDLFNYTKDNPFDHVAVTDNTLKKYVPLCEPIARASIMQAIRALRYERRGYNVSKS